MAHGTLLEQPGGLGPRRGLRGTLRRYALLPLRAFLGVTFVHAGLDKLTDSAFLSATGPGSLGELLDAVHATAGAPFLVDLAQHSPVGFGYALALGELLVGLATLLGFRARVAAAGGALISLVLWLTVSWPTTPYYYGNDLAYLLAWLPLALAGAEHFSADEALRQRRRRGRDIGLGLGD
ncbi:MULTISPECIES: DoxX family membrane protein [Streptomyces]|uniref:Membrane protein n=4 Tax=Streptomyces TaxID=1883 RepID=A0A8H9LMZ4_9ACTN|nr:MULTISPECIES: DoxX family membrane protein [Streptomyces]NEE28784.1 DoxX family membrane protein [Streptomyces sp. SID7982]MBL3806390.1 DoxX family membrane protein [Streptomyces sp. BRB081]MDQ0295190.1 thiosulfate dehydrogenase [quinone] large subunit [Streptomyces sp. DSM 41037]QNE81463.1 DoxX family membrane protein [Streptomyces rutgersensis]RPK91844.1 DoxX [Streptomyces sp. ADI98-12]